MPPARSACGTYGAYRRHLKLGEPIDAACRKAQKVRDAGLSKSAPARVARAQSKKAAAADAVTPAVVPVGPVPEDADGHVSRLEVLKELLTEQRLLMPSIRVSDPARAYLLMREQRETVREISELQGNGQVKGVTLADQLADVRARRRAGAAAS